MYKYPWWGGGCSVINGTDGFAALSLSIGLGEVDLCLGFLVTLLSPFVDEYPGTVGAGIQGGR